MAKTPAWQRKAGKNPKGGLNEAGRRSARAQGMNLKRPVKSGDNPRRASFLARMGNMRGPERRNGKPTRLLLSLRAWGASSKADARQRQNQLALETNGRDEHGIWIWRWTQKIWINDEDGSKEKAGGYSHRNEARRKEAEAWLRKNLRSTRPVIIPSLACASACFSRSLVAMFKAPLLANGRLGKPSSWPSATRQPVGGIETNA